MREVKVVSICLSSSGSPLQIIPDDAADKLVSGLPFQICACAVASFTGYDQTARELYLMDFVG